MPSGRPLIGARRYGGRSLAGFGTRNEEPRPATQTGRCGCWRIVEVRIVECSALREFAAVARHADRRPPCHAAGSECPADRRPLRRPSGCHGRLLSLACPAIPDTQSRRARWKGGVGAVVSMRMPGGAAQRLAQASFSSIQTSDPRNRQERGRQVGLFPSSLMVLPFLKHGRQF